MRVDPRRGLYVARFLAAGLMLGAQSALAKDLHTFDIGRADLATVLTRIALVARTPIALPAGLVDGRMAGPIRGREALDAALTRALAGTDLEIVHGAGGLVIRSASQPHPAQAPSSPLAEVPCLSADATRATGYRVANGPESLP